MLGKLSQLRILGFTANTKTIHMRGSSVYCMLNLKDSCFTMCAMAEDTRKFETDSFFCGYYVCWMLVIGEQLVCETEEENPRD